MAELATRADIQALSDKIDGLMKTQTEFLQRLVALEHRPIYQQPCDTAKKMFETLVSMQTCGCARLKEHLDRHRDIGSDWRRALVSVVSGILIGLLMSTSTLALKGWLAESHQRVEHKQDWKGMP